MFLDSRSEGDDLSSTPARAKRLAPFSSARLAPSPDGPLTHFASTRGEKCRLVKDLKALIRDRHGLLLATWRDIQARFFRLWAEHSNRKHPDGCQPGLTTGCFRSGSLLPSRLEILQVLKVIRLVGRR